MALQDDDLSLPEGPLASTKASLDKIKAQLTATGRFLLQGSLPPSSALKHCVSGINDGSLWIPPLAGWNTGLKEVISLQRGQLILILVAQSSSLQSICKDSQNMMDAVFTFRIWQKKNFFCVLRLVGQLVLGFQLSTLQAAQLVLKAHKEAVSSLGGTGSAKLGTVAAVVAAANATAKEAAKEIAAAMQASTLPGTKPDSPQGSDMPMDAMSIMKETLRVKDEELHQVAKEMRARDATIKELAERLSETAEAAEAAASAAKIMDKERKAVRTEIAKLRGELDEKLRLISVDLKILKQSLLAAERSRDEALQEAQKWRAELAKAREHAVIMEAALLRAKEAARQAVADTKSYSKNTPEATVSAEDAMNKEEKPSQSHSQNGISSIVDDGNTMLPQHADLRHHTDDDGNSLLGMETAHNSKDEGASVFAGILDTVEYKAQVT